jgi:uncharacterized protein YegL
MVLIFVVDTSGSMEGEKIGAVNYAIESVLPELKKISEGNEEAEIKVAVLEFSSDARWQDSPPPPFSVEQFYRWTYLKTGGVTNFGMAYRELAKKLSSHNDGFMTASGGSIAPVIILLSDGQSTDASSKYAAALEELRQNDWFKFAIRIALAIGEAAAKNVLADFTGTEEAVMSAYNKEALIKMLRFMSVRPSQIRSVNQGWDPGSALGTAANQMKQVIDEMHDAQNRGELGTDVRDPWAIWEGGQY